MKTAQEIAQAYASDVLDHHTGVDVRLVGTTAANVAKTAEDNGVSPRSALVVYYATVGKELLTQEANALSASRRLELAVTLLGQVPVADDHCAEQVRKLQRYANTLAATIVGDKPT